MKVKLSEKYPNPAIVTVKGFTLVQGEIKDLDPHDKELRSYLEQGLIVVVKDESEDVKDDEITQDVIIDDIPDTSKAVKEVVSKTNKPAKTLKASTDASLLSENADESSVDEKTDGDDDETQKD